MFYRQNNCGLFTEKYDITRENPGNANSYKSICYIKFVQFLLTKETYPIKRKHLYFFSSKMHKVQSFRLIRLQRFNISICILINIQLIN